MPLLCFEISKSSSLWDKGTAASIFAALLLKSYCSYFILPAQINTLNV
jgi:hypothetical protein